MYFEKKILLSKLNDLLDNCIKNELSDNTLKKYKTNLIFFIDFIDNKKIENQTIIDFKKKLLEKYTSVNTINSYIVTANMLLKYMKLSDLCVKSEKVQTKTSSKDYINYADYHRLLRFAYKKKKKKMYFIIRVLCEVGIRIEELKYFKVETLKNVVTVKNKGKTRDVLVKRDLLVALKKYAREEHIYSGYLFPGKTRDVPIHPSTVRKNMRRLAGRAKVKLKKSHPHSCRHYFATRYLLFNKDDLRTLQDLLGHSDIRTTVLYTSFSTSEKLHKLREVKF